MKKYLVTEFDDAQGVTDEINADSLGDAAIALLERMGYILQEDDEDEEDDKHGSPDENIMLTGDVREEGTHECKPL